MKNPDVRHLVHKQRKMHAVNNTIWDFDRDDNLQVFAQPYLSESEYTDDELREMDVLQNKRRILLQQHLMHASWYCCERVSKTDIEEKKLMNKVIAFVFFVHKTIFS